MYILVSIEELPYRYTTDSLGKKFLPIFVKITEGGLNFYFSFSFLFLFSFSFSIYFLFLELELGLSDKDHAVT